MSITDWLRHAFALGEAHPPLTETEQALVERVCRAVSRRGMTVPAILLLESLRPLNQIGSQALYFFEPFLTALGDPQAVRQFATFLERRDAIERLCQKLESLQSP